MSSISIPYNNRKESVTASNHILYGAIKEEDGDIKDHFEARVDSENVLNLPGDDEKESQCLHQKRDSHLSLNTIPLDRISVMTAQRSVHSEGMHVH